jgi:hypothetical protein
MVQSQPGQIPQKKNITKKGWWSDSRVGLSSNPNTTKKKTKKKEKTLNIHYKSGEVSHL